MTTPAEVIDWIETALMDEINFRDIPDIIADARTRFGVSLPSDSCREDSK
jgi:hypothetical protein